MSVEGPRVSVILNSYNQVKYVREAVESVLGQTFVDFELLLIDNGSTDDSRTILKSFESDSRVRLLLHDDNRSITKRFNDAIACARGEFVSFLYSDDYYLPNKLHCQVAAFDSLSADYGVVYGPSEGFNEITRRRWTYGSIAASGHVLKDLFLGYERGQIDMIAPLTRRRCLTEFPFDEDIFAEGEGIFYRIALKYRFQYLPQALTVVRDHVANAGKAIRRNAEMTMTWLDRLEARPDFPDDHRGYLRSYRATLLRNYGWQSVRTDCDVDWARRSFRRAFSADWKKAIHPRVFFGVGLSLVPSAFRRHVNKWSDSMFRHKHNSVAVSDFGGSIGKL